MHQNKKQGIKPVKVKICPSSRKQTFPIAAARFPQTVLFFKTCDLKTKSFMLLSSHKKKNLENNINYIQLIDADNYNAECRSGIHKV